MYLARVSANGQITVPVEIRRALKLKEGDKILFMQRDSGEFVVDNASVAAIKRAQDAFEGVAESLGFPSEDAIQSWVDELRYGKEAQA